MYHFGPLPNPQRELPEIHLGLLAGLGLESDRCQLRPAPPLAQRLDVALHLLVAAREPQTRQLPLQHHPVPSHLWTAPLNKPAKCIDRTWPRLILPWLPLPRLQPAPDRLAIHPELSRDASAALAPFRTPHNLRHHVSAYHPLLRRSA